MTQTITQEFRRAALQIGQVLEETSVAYARRSVRYGLDAIDAYQAEAAWSSIVSDQLNKTSACSQKVSDTLNNMHGNFTAFVERVAGGSTTGKGREGSLVDQFNEVISPLQQLKAVAARADDDELYNQTYDKIEGTIRRSGIVDMLRGMSGP